MQLWKEELIACKKKRPFPILSFPVIQLLNININEFITSSKLQAEGMLRVVKELDMPAAISLMDLSVEAEAFGAEIKFFEQEIPAVIGKIVNDEQDAENLHVPSVGTARTAINLEAIEIVKNQLKDRPVFAGCIGPFSLAGRLMGVSDAVVSVRRKPNMVRILLEKSTDYLIQYIKEYKKRGADGVMVAEPLAGLLAPRLAEEYSNLYMKQIINAVQDENFSVIYHNCGESVSHMIDSLIELGAAGFHFGNAINISNVVPRIPTQYLIMGNLDPVSVLKNGTAKDVYEKSMQLLKENGNYSNYILSTGCDIPPMTSWNNIRSLFKAVEDYYKN